MVEGAGYRYSGGPAVPDDATGAFGEQRDEVRGAFFASHQDGNLRMDYTQQSVCALLQFLAYEGAASVPG